MAAETNIEWCDATFNPWIGCTRISPACDDCYAARSTPARTRGIEWGPGKKRERTSPANWKLPVKWNAQAYFQCVSCGWRGSESQLDASASRCPRCVQKALRPARRRVFCASLADVFDNEVPFAWREALFNLIGRTGNLDWLLLTKRIGNVKEMVAGSYMPLNVWLGITVVNQAEVDRDVPKLLQVRARVRFLSIEPMLGRVDASAYFEQFPDRNGVRVVQNNEGIDWIIAGGESGGAEARPMHPSWPADLRDQCAAADIPFLFKQWGAWMPGKLAHEIGLIPIEERHPFGLCQPAMARAPKKMTGRLLDGQEHLAWPA